MFGNLNSFHDTVAESKAERERQDRLLTISTPRERLLIYITVVVFLASGVWLLAGEVKQNLSVNGVLTVIETPSDDDNQMLEVFIWLNTDDASRITIGNPVKLGFSSEAGDFIPIEGAIVTLNPTLPNEQIRLISELTDGSLYQVGISPVGNSDIASMLNKKCLVEIQLGSVTPFQYFLLG